MPDYYRTHLDLDVKILPPISVDPAAFDKRRNQFVAEQVIASMERSLPEVAADQTATVIGVLEDDMYAFNWNFAFSLRRDHRFAVVSSNRMVPSFYRVWR